MSKYCALLDDSQGKTPADVHGGYLLEEGNWTSEDWTSFYVTCVHCIQEYVDKGLVAFNDHVLHDRQLLAAASHDETLLQIMQGFIEEVVRSGGVIAICFFWNDSNRKDSCTLYLNCRISLSNLAM